MIKILLVSLLGAAHISAAAPTETKQPARDDDSHVFIKNSRVLKKMEKLDFFGIFQL